MLILLLEVLDQYNKLKKRIGMEYTSKGTDKAIHNCKHTKSSKGRYTNKTLYTYSYKT